MEKKKASSTQKVRTTIHDSRKRGRGKNEKNRGRKAKGSEGETMENPGPGEDPLMWVNVEKKGAGQGHGGGQLGDDWRTGGGKFGLARGGQKKGRSCGQGSQTKKKIEKRGKLNFSVGKKKIGHSFRQAGAR